MATTFGFFADAALTIPLSGITATQKADVVVDDPVVTQVWFGSLGSAGGNTADVKLQRDSDPGVDQINFSVVVALGAVHVASEIRLSASLPADWLTVPAGAALGGGATITSGTGNAFTFFIYVDDATHAVSLLTDLSIETDALLESVV